MRVESHSQPSPDWDACVSDLGGGLGHAAAWPGILEGAYGLRMHALEARESGGDLVGILPLAGFRTLRGRRELVSLPFLDAAGILARTAAAAAALRHAALRLARETGARAVELRGLAAAPVLDATTPDRVELALPLERTEEAQWKSLPASVRNQTRKARREGLCIASDPPDDLCRAFHRVFRENMRDLGSPTHSERFFALASERFGPRLRFVVATLGERPVGGLVAIHFGGRLWVPWASTLRSERRRCPNNLIYWEAIRWAVECGADQFEFGRSVPGSGTHRFKRGWGATERPLAWTRLGSDGAALPPGGSRDSALLRRLSNAWTSVPVPISAILGPRIRRFLPE
jgi:FemAB-related protein (PEP-CTERM system-associated)